MWQLTIDGLPSQFPALKTLGTASSLPHPATHLIGRDGELAELAALVRSDECRLLTLTGFGGTGKTRLAVGLAQQLIESFPDGVYFVPLATATTEDAMWRSIGEVLDVPPEGRIPPGFFTYVVGRSALMVLDNLEQLQMADLAVSRLLAEAPQVVVVATSRRPLHLTMEHEHPVPPLELPGEATIEDAERSGAVQLFVQRARMVRPDFEVTTSNAADVVAVCEQLDGVPLALELAAARTALFTPAALVERLSHGLELKDRAVDRPARHQTMHATIAWSYDLLSPTLKALFRRLGVFAGGAELDALAAVMGDAFHDGDELELVTDLIDSSLVKVRTGNSDGEPRLMMLETVRTFALHQLEQAGELDEVHRLHAQYYLDVVRRLAPLTRGHGDTVVETRNRFEVEHDNVHEALAWALADTAPPSRVSIGVAICAVTNPLWLGGGYVAEGTRWLERAVTTAGTTESPELASCLSSLSWDVSSRELDRALDIARRGIAMWRRLDDPEGLSFALSRSAVLQSHRGNHDTARQQGEEAVGLAREAGASSQLANALAQLSNAVSVAQDHERAYELIAEAVAVSEEHGEDGASLVYRSIAACVLRELGRLTEARQEMWALIPQSLLWSSPENLAYLAEDYGAVLAAGGDYEEAVRLLGAADSARERIGAPRSNVQVEEIAAPFASARSALPTSVWERAYASGHDRTVEDVLMVAHAAYTGVE